MPATAEPREKLAAAKEEEEAAAEAADLAAGAAATGGGGMLATEVYMLDAVIPANAAWNDECGAALAVAAAGVVDDALFALTCAAGVASASAIIASSVISSMAGL